MKKTIIISMITIATLSLAACGKKEAAGVVVTAQDTGKDTTTSELVKGDSAGEKTSVGSNKTATTTEQEDKSNMDILWEKYGEAMLLGEWSCDNGETWILDNGYNLTIKSPSFKEDKIGSWGYDTEGLTTSIWNDETQIEVTIFNENGEATGTDVRDSTIETYSNYIIEDVYLKDDESEGKIVLKDDEGNVKNLSLNRKIQYDNNTISCYENKKKYTEAKEKILEEEERQNIEALGINYDEYKAEKNTTNELMNQLAKEAKEANMSIDDYVETLGGYDVIFNNHTDHE